MVNRARTGTVNPSSCAVVVAVYASRFSNRVAELKSTFGREFAKKLVEGVVGIWSGKTGRAEGQVLGRVAVLGQRLLLSVSDNVLLLQSLFVEKQLDDA